MSIKLNSTQSCLDSLGFFLSLAEVSEISIPEKKIIAVSWDYTYLDGFGGWAAFNVSQPENETGFKYSLFGCPKIERLRRTVISLQHTIQGLSSGANNFKVQYEGTEDWQPVNFEIDPNWEIIRLLPISTN